VTLAELFKEKRKEVKFVLTIIGNTHFMLMSSSRALDAQTIISLYAHRSPPPLYE
jgi:hypothetical protein